MGFFLFGIQLVFIAFKLYGIFDFSWWVIFLPSLIVCLLFVFSAFDNERKMEKDFDERFKEIEERVNESMKDRDFTMYGDECGKCGSYKPFQNVGCKYCTKIEIQNDAIKELKSEIEKLKLRVRRLENCVYR